MLYVENWKLKIESDAKQDLNVSLFANFSFVLDWILILSGLNTD